MILSDKALKDRIIQDHQQAEQAKEWWEKGEWNKIGNKIVIDPFKTHAVGVCSYDLSVGQEYISLRDPYHTKQLNEGENFNIDPGETVLILTEEYICLPRKVMTIVVPRARWIFEGTAIQASRVDPTWYGKLLIGFSNLAKNPVALGRGEDFCTCYFMEGSETQTVLTKDKVPFLGRTKIVRVDFRHIRPQDLLPADRVEQRDIDKVVDMYGWPWDVARGMFYLNKRLLEDYIDNDKLPELTERLGAKVSLEVTKEVGKVTNRMFYTLVAAFTAIIGLLGYLVYSLLRLVSSGP